MEHPTFDTFFTAAMTTEATRGHGRVEAFDYQRRLACGERSGESDIEWLSSGADCRSVLLNVPTGCGKTAAVVLAWLWNRVVLQRPGWPRRLVYCLPMRVLVEQTEENVRGWLHALANAGPDMGPSGEADLARLAKTSPVVLMGGEDEGDWDLYPEKEAILIGTQDMLLSRALNRGYAASRARWPMHFGLLNTDCLWVFDEVQLMGPGLATTTQLEAFRWLLGSKDGHGCHSVWMSATLQREWLETVDFRGSLADLRSVEFGECDRTANEDANSRWLAQKALQKAVGAIGDVQSLASDIRSRHRQGTRTIVVMNTVKRACDLFEALENASHAPNPSGKNKKGKKSGVPEPAPMDPAREPALILLHSRFRPGDRAKAVAAALADPTPAGTIIVSTQVIEAGVDLSATTLFTELAPWASLVQRFGRCNRRGDDNVHAQVRWIDAPAEDTDAAATCAPYQASDLQESAERLRVLTDVALASLPDVKLSFQHTHVVRRKDLIDLFDTTPDLAGSDIDIDRFVRGVDDSDVRLFWRDWSQQTGKEPPPDDTPPPRSEELCSAPVGQLRDFLRGQDRASKVWLWNFLDGKWDRADSRTSVPGQVLLVHASAGGYDTRRGWNPTRSACVEPITTDRAQKRARAALEGTDADPVSRLGVWQTIADHTDQVCTTLEAILSLLPIDHRIAVGLRLAARWHDRGKAHDKFQEAIDDGQTTRRDGKTVSRRERPAAWRGHRLVAKAPDEFWSRYGRKHFRHELAAALAALDPRNTGIPDDLRDLVSYVVAAHHGKIRLSLRSLPGENKPPNAGAEPQPAKRFARGVWEGDVLPEVPLGGGVIAPSTDLSLEPMELGLCQDEPFVDQPSWGERMIRLRDSLGPFQLAFYEALVRAADRRASLAAAERAAEREEAGNA